MKTKQQKRAKLQQILPQFYGSLQLYRYSPFLFPDFVLTDGIKALAEIGECYWLLDKIASLQHHKKIQFNTSKHDLQLWKLKVKPDESASLSCTVNDVIYSEKISYTDFPLEEITIIVGHSRFTDGRPHTVACLVSER